MSRGFLGVIVGVILIFVGIIVVTNHKGNNGDSSRSNSAALTQHVEGNPNAKVKLVEYGDYQCPFCQQYYPIVKQAFEDNKDQIQFQFRNFPLVNAHQNAFAAARAAEAAGLQGKYWQMHDLLYENNDPNGQSGWVASSDPTTYLNQFAQQIGLNLNQFKTDYSSAKVNDAINADTAEGNRLGIDGTPTFYLDGKKLDASQLVDKSGRPSVDAFDKVIRAEVAKKGGSTQSSTSGNSTNTSTSNQPATAQNQ